MSAIQVNRLRFFSRPEDGYTVVDAEDVVWEPILVGDLLFEAPSGAWEPGRHVLAIGPEFGTIRIPIDLKSRGDAAAPTPPRPAPLGRRR